MISDADKGLPDPFCVCPQKASIETANEDAPAVSLDITAQADAPIDLAGHPPYVS